MRVAATVVWCVTLLLIAGIAAHTYKTRGRAADVVTVTGLAKQDFDADLVVWTGRFVARNADLKKAYEQLKHDQELVKKFLDAKQADATETTYYSVGIDKEFDKRRDKDGQETETFKGYLLTQSVQVESKSIEKVEAIARDITSVIDSGVEFYSDAPQYFYTNLGELKIAMIAAATQDGKQRADKIAENAGGKLGPLRYSSLGVFQITRPNSNTEVSWQGSFDTTSRRKTAAVTIRLQFGLL
jgi:hypothetical protein